MKYYKLVVLTTRCHSVKLWQSFKRKFCLIDYKFFKIHSISSIINTVKHNKSNKMKKTIILAFLALLLSPLAFSQVGIGTTTPATDAILDLTSTDRALLVTRVANTAAVVAPVNGMIIYDISSNCIKSYQSGAWTECNAITTPTVGAINCANALISGTLTATIPASSVTATIPYTGANGGSYVGQIVSSTGVSGLTATVAGGVLANGAGSVIYTITGTPSSSGIASFAITLLDKSCTFTINVDQGAPQVASLNCAGAVVNGTLTTAVFTTAVFVTVPYTGGNGIAYSGQSIASTGVLGLSATLSPGTLANGSSDFIFQISGTPAGGGVASFPFTLGGQSCTFAVNVVAPPTISSWANCSSASAGTLVVGVAASGVTQTATYNGGNGVSYPATSVTSSGVSGLTANLAAGVLANGAGSVTFTITGTPATSGTARFNVNLFGAACSFTRIVEPPTVAAITCGSAIFSPITITSGVSYSGTFTVPYTGGNGAPYAAGTAINSTIVTGLTATLQAGTLAVGTGGTFTYTITGTASSSGNAIFALSFGSQSCTLTKAVSPPFALACANTVFSPARFTANVAYSGTATVPYTNGNGASYAAGTAINSTGVTGLTATLQAGTLANGAGNLIYTISGTPSGNGVASFAISLNGSSCTMTFSSCGAFIATGVYKVFMCHNLGATNTTLDPNIPVQAIHGNYYQWGRATIVANASTPSGAIGGWNTASAADGSWLDASKTVNDPCPAGFRVPTAADWTGVRNTNTVSRTGTWAADATNFGTAVHFGPSTSDRTLTLPAAGFRDPDDGTLTSRASLAHYWSSSATSFASTGKYFGSDFFFTTVANLLRTNGFSVRCIAE